MVSRLVAELKPSLSCDRLESYRPANGSDHEMVVNYFFNLELSEALYPSLQAFEVALRNSVHHACTQHFGTERWFDTPDLYPPSPLPGADPWQKLAIQSAKDHLTQHNKSHDPGRIVAELHLGYWNSLFNRPFVQKLWLPNQGEMLKRVFPFATRSQQVPRQLEKRITKIRLLRNRVMHFEPIWNRRHLQQNHADILEVLAWMSPTMSEMISLCDRFPQVLATGRERLQQDLDQEIARRYSLG